MKRVVHFHKVVIAVYAIMVLLFCHHFIFRPIFLDWGADDSIRNISFSGDEFTTGGDQHTRAVLIKATPEQLWPWLIQIGQERGGFYSHQGLENLFRADMTNVYWIEPRFQNPRMEGDTIWLASKDSYQGIGYQIVAEVTPFKSFVMVGGEDYAKIRTGKNASGSWAFYLHPETDTTTWLVARSSAGDITIGEKVIRYFTYEVPHFIMESKMLNTVKRLAEK